MLGPKQTPAESAEQVRNDTAVFTRLYRHYYERIFRYCVHRVFDRAAAEDLTSIVFLKAAENFARFRGDEKAFGCWLYRIATNAANSHLRELKRRRQLWRIWAQNHAGDLKQAPAAPERLTALRRALLELKPQYQTVITLYYFENKNLAQIAQMLGRPDATIRSHLSRARKKLHRLISAAEHDDQGKAMKQGTEP